MSSIAASIITKVVTTTVSSAAAASATADRATPQGGVLEGGNPSKYDLKNPIILFIIQTLGSVLVMIHRIGTDDLKHREVAFTDAFTNRQERWCGAGIIIIFCRILHYPLSKLRQPRVIAEVIGGIILGPSVMMRIPGFQDAIFPTTSMPNLNLVANLGLVLFLFLVGLEVNMRMFLSNWRVALSVGLAGMILPFGLGCAIAWGLYNQFRNEPGTVPITFGVYMLFIGTALSITAFPVLCRILTELKLLSTPVGVTVLAAGVGNDVVGWILLALCVALVNNGSGITALYVLLCAIGWVLFLVYAVRPAFLYLVKRSGSLENGPTQGMVALTLLCVLTSSWFTAIIGIHPIFGECFDEADTEAAFLMGLICPHEGGFAIKLTEKIEDLVSVLFLPLYFALSGLGTNIGLLNDGITWAYVIGVIAVAFSAKIVGGTVAAKLCGAVWRESFTIGVLMSCKGLVELIVLNIGLQAKILSTRTFTIFVVMALVTTVTTTPLTLSLYPAWYQKKLESWKKGEIDWDGNPLIAEGGSDTSNDHPHEKLNSTQVRRLLVYLRLDSLPSLFTFISLLGGETNPISAKVHRSRTELASVPEGADSSTDSTSALISKRPLEVHGVRILELTERTSSVMKVSEQDDYTYRDPVVNAFRTFAQLNNVAVSGDVSIVPEDSYAETLATQASDHFSDLVLIPWSEPSSTSELDHHESLASGLQDAFIQKTLDNAKCNTAIFYNRGFGGPIVKEPRSLSRSVSGHSINRHHESTPPVADRSHHVYFPFFGGADDRVALRFVLQLAQNSNITATIHHFDLPTPAGPSSTEKSPQVTQSSVHPDASRPGSSSIGIAERVDNDLLNAAAAQDSALVHTLRDSLPAGLINRVVFVDVATTTPISDCLSNARLEVGQSPHNAGDLIVVGRGRHTRIAHHEHASSSSNHEMRRTLGVVGEAIISSGISGSVLVIQAGGRGLEI
ncbi:K(+)/H(+) antiporter [Lachnellula suecica]|uniref:K(+)/H(+) antiporter n=1 Tax=Lachnellula suecica TaxID=602035 RepID=A0A8T9C277_9HELO|nr:K(+)/H(+) antiporter [Lachnellula suecica]